MKTLKDKTLLEGQQRDAFFNELVKKSNQVKSKVHKACDGKQKSSDQLREALNEIELGVGQIYDLKADSNAASAQLRDHIMDIYNRTVVGLLKKQQKLNDNLKLQESEWQATCNKLIEEQQFNRGE